jgi:hypothetical protein
MNKRILKLAKQSGMRSPDLFKLTVSHMSTDTLEKFAELIVAKCVAQCEFVAGQAEITNTGEMARKTKATANNCAFLIKEYFGVEE